MNLGIIPRPSSALAALARLLRITPTDIQFTRRITAPDLLIGGASIPGRLLRTTIYTANDTWTLQADVSYVEVEGVGGGGGGGTGTGGASQAGAGGGGAAGAYFRKKILRVVLNATEAITIGVGGPSATAGSATSFGAHASAGGGDKGANQAAGAGLSTVDFGTGGTATGGDLNLRGSNGGYGLRLSGTVARAGSGANGYMGCGGAIGDQVAGAGLDAQGKGAGGAGGLALTAVTNPGGSGSPGILIVREYA